MLIINKIKNSKTNPTLLGSNSCLCVIPYNNCNFKSLRSASFSSNLRRVVPFYSAIKLRFDQFFGKSGASFFNTYIKVFSSVHAPYTTKNDLPINAAKILISFPLLWVTLSTNMVNRMFAYNIDVNLPVYTWGLLDRYFVRVERENFGIGPGLFGFIYSYDKECTFSYYLEQLFTDEFLYLCLVGTDFERLVTKRVSEQNVVSYHVDISFRNALDSRLHPFNCKVYSDSFLIAVSAFYSDFSSKFYTKLVTVCKLPDRRVNFEVGLHTFRNHEFDGCYIFHTSINPKLDTSYFFNSFIILSVLFKMEFYHATNESYSDIKVYGDGIPGNNELYIDFTSVKFIDCLKTLFSAGIRTHVVENGKKKAIAPLNALEAPFGGQRQYSTIANLEIRKLGSGESTIVGRVAYSLPICCFGYSKVDFGNNRYLIVDTS